MRPHKIRRSYGPAALLAAIVLGGCATDPNEGVKKIDAVRAECDARLGSGVYKNFSERTRCLNDGLTAIYVDTHYPYMDLVFLSNAYRLAVAERYDRGAITGSQAEAIMAEVDQRIAGEERKRATSPAYARAVAAHGAVGLLHGLGASHPSLHPSQWQPITCTEIGNVVSCF